MIIEFDIPDIEIASTNEMYMPRPRKTKNGRWTAYVTKTNEMREFEESVNPLLESFIVDDTVKLLHEELEDRQKAIRLELTYYLPSFPFFTSDASNYVKTIEDRIKERIDIDDVRNCEVILRKVLSDNLSTHVKLETYDLDYEIPEGKWPKKIKR